MYASMIELHCSGLCPASVGFLVRFLSKMNFVAIFCSEIVELVEGCQRLHEDYTSFLIFLYLNVALSIILMLLSNLDLKIESHLIYH